MHDETTDRIIEMAWQDRVTFDAIQQQFGIPESEVIKIMRRELKPSSFKMWRRRVSGRSTKHASKRGMKVSKFKSQQQRAISGNKIT